MSEGQETNFKWSLRLKKLYKKEINNLTVPGQLLLISIKEQLRSSQENSISFFVAKTSVSRLSNKRVCKYVREIKIYGEKEALFSEGLGTTC